MKVTLVLFVVGTLGTPAKALDKRLKTISIETKITELQKLYIPAESLLTPYLKNDTYLLVEINVRLSNNSNNKKKK